MRDPGGILTGGRDEGLTGGRAGGTNATPMRSAEPPPLAAASLRDFADRWPAMVVKELGQGLRTRGFVIPFLLLHGLVLTAVALEYLLTRAGATASALLRAAAGGGGRRRGSRGCFGWRCMRWWQA